MRFHLSSCWLVLLASIALRGPGMLHDFWFDEAWSSLLVRELVSSPLDILTRVHIDNNHPLNSFFLYALGDQTAWSVYRIPSFVLGIGAVILSGHIMSRRGRAHAVAAMILTGCSYPLIVYSSEARGYAPMIFFVLLAIDAHERYLVTREWLALTTFWVAAILGFLSHLTFVHAYGAILLWAGYEARKRTGDFQHALANVAGTQSLPLLFLAGFYLVYIRHLHVAGGEPAPLLSVLAETVGVTLGTPTHGVWVWVAVALLAVLLGVGLKTVRGVDAGLFILFLSGILIVPGLGVLIELRRALMEPRFFPRYFLVSIILFLLLCGWVVGEQYQKGATRRLAAAVIVIGYLLGNLWHAAAFITVGRGHYRDALNYMARETGDSTIRVSSNSDFRTRVLLAFYGRYLPTDKTVIFYQRTSPRVAEAGWRIREDLEPTRRVPREIDDGRGHRFRLMERYSFHGLSGCQWSLYERVNGSAAPAERRRAH